MRTSHKISRISDPKLYEVLVSVSYRLLNAKRKDTYQFNEGVVFTYYDLVSCVT